jgi:hypothetical protein
MRDWQNNYRAQLQQLIDEQQLTHQIQPTKKSTLPKIYNFASML